MNIADLMEQMAEAGAPLPAILIAVRALEAQGQNEADRKAKDAARKRDERAVSKDNPRTVRGQSKNVRAASPHEDTSTPQPVTTGARAPSVTVAKIDLFVCPPGVDPVHWRDFMVNRKRKHCAKTETAYRGILSDLAKHADAEWPPGRLVQHAAAKGWASINDPRTPLGHAQNGHAKSAPANLRGSRPSPALDMWRSAEAELAAERENEEADRPARLALPPIHPGGP